MHIKTKKVWILANLVEVEGGDFLSDGILERDAETLRRNAQGVLQLRQHEHACNSTHTTALLRSISLAATNSYPKLPAFQHASQLPQPNPSKLTILDTFLANVHCILNTCFSH